MSSDRRSKKSIILTALLGCSFLATPVIAQEVQGENKKEVFYIPKVLLPSEVKQEEAKGDNLGNHTAERNIDMDGHIITKLITDVGDMTSSVNMATLEEYMKNAKGDNLGNHIATTTLNLASNKITNLANAYGGADGDGVNIWTLKKYIDDIPADNLGNHIATQNLVMSGHSINMGGITGYDPVTGVPKIGPGVVIGTDYIRGLALPAQGSDAANKDYVDSRIKDVDLSGVVFTTKDQTIDGVKTFVRQVIANAGLDVANAKVIRLADPSEAMDAVNLRTLQAAIGSIQGDNLGNHIATQTLDMNNNMIDNVNVMNIRNQWAKTIRFLDENRVMKGRIQHSAQDNTIRMSLLDPASNSLASVTLSTNNGFYPWGGAWFNANNLKVTAVADPTDPQDAVNLRTLQAAISAIKGDNLGNHIATQTLDMNGNAIADARVISITNSKTQALQFLEDGSKIENAAIYRSAQGAGSLRLQLRDSAGNITGAVSLTPDGGFYPWGTAYLNANLRKVINVDDPTEDLDAVNLRTLKTAIAALKGDNLGNHTATTNLNLSNFKAINLADPTLDQDGVNLRTLNAAIAAIKGDNLGNHVATMNLDMSNFKVVNVSDPSDAQDVVNLRTLQALIAAVKGDNLGNHTATQNINVSNFKVTNLADPTAAQDGVNLRTLQNAVTNVKGDNLGNHTATTNINAANFKVINVAAPTAGGDVTNKTYVDNLFASAGKYSASDGITFGTAVAGAVPISVNSTVVRTTGNQSIAGIKTFTGKISANEGITTNNKKIEMVADPTAPQDAVNLRTLNAAITGTADNLGNHTATTNINAANFKVVNVAAPTAGGDATNKLYVDNLFGTVEKYSAADGITFGSPVSGVVPISVNATVVRTTGNQSIGGVKTFTDKLSANAGITTNNQKVEMVADPTAPQDAVNLRTLQAAVSGSGDNLGNHTATTNINAATFKVTNVGAPTLGGDATNKTYVDNLFNSIGPYLAGDGLDLTGNTFSVDSTVVRTTGNQNVGGIKSFTAGSVNINGDGNTRVTFRDTGSVPQAILFLDAANNTINLRKYAADGTTTVANLSLMADGRVSPTTGRFDGANKIISTVADPVAPQDAVNLRTLQASVTNAGDNLGNHTANTNINVANFKVVNVAGPTAGTDATNKTYVDNLFNSAAKYSAADGISFGTPVSGVTPVSVNTSVVRTTGNQTIGGVKTFSSKITASAGITLGNQKAEMMADPTAPQDGVNLRTLQAAVANAGDNLGNHTATQNINAANFKVVNVGAPTAGSDATNKTYVDALFASAPKYSAGDGLDLSGTTFSVDNTVVRTSGNQSVGGIKTFTSSSVVISGDSNNQLWFKDASNVNRAVIFTGASDNSMRIRNYAADGTTTAGELLLHVDGRIMPATGKFDGNNKVISTVADPVSSQDAVNLRTLRDYITAGTGLTFNSTTGALAVDNTVVRTSGDQSIRGVKTFNNQVNIGATQLTSNRFNTDGNFGFNVGEEYNGYGDTAGQKIRPVTMWLGSDNVRVEDNVTSPYNSPQVLIGISRPAGTPTHAQDGGNGLIMRLGYRSARFFRPLEVNGSFYVNEPLSDFKVYNKESTFNTGEFLVKSQGNDIILDGRRYRTDIPGSSSGGKLIVYGRAEATGGFYTSSDASLKKNIKEISPQQGMDIVRRIEPVTYDMKSDDKHAAGVIAQQLKDVMPYAVSTTPDGKLAVEYTQVIAPMIAAIHDLDDRVTALENKQ